MCVAGSRLLVQESIREDLVRRMVEKVSTLGAGDPLDPTTRYGALVSRAHVDKVTGYIAQGQGDGARLAHRGAESMPVAGGFYVAPHVFERVDPRQPLAREEIFGPVLAVLSFRDDDEAVRLANDTIYGLSAIAWTRDLKRGHRLAAGIRAGSITINATAQPKGGVSEGVLAVGGHKQSGIGVEGGLAGLEAYTTSSAVQYFV